MKNLLYFEILMVLLFGFTRSANAIEETSQSFTLDGRAYSTANASTPLLDTIATKIQILNQNETCILYEETQSIVTTATNGYFSIQVGSAIGAGKRSGNDSGNSMQKVFSNTQASVSGKLVSNGAACTYTPANGDKRYVRLQMTPASDGVLRTISPNMALDSVPSALIAERAETVQGLGAANLLQVNTTGVQALSQTNLESIFTSTNFANLTTLLATPPASYMKTGSNGSVGLPSVSTGSGNPASGLTAGQIWYDATNGVLKYYDGSVKTVGSGGASSFSNQSANTVFAGPTSGGAAAPAFRALTGADMPSTVLLNGGNAATAALNIGSATGSAHDVNLMTAGSAKMTVKSSGEVGIGTTSPSKTLDIQGTDSNVGTRIMNTNSTSARYPGLEVFNYMGAAGLGSPSVELINNRGTSAASLPVLATDILGKLQFAGGTDNATGYRGSASIVGIARENYSTSASGSALGFYTTTSGTNTTLERMRIDENGYVGIGTSPAEKLDVEGTVAAGKVEIKSRNLSSTGKATLGLYNDAGDWLGLEVFGSAHSSIGDRNNTKITAANDVTFVPSSGFQNGGSGKISFLTGGWDSSTQTRMTITSSGNVGIGLTSPSALLNIKAGTATAGTAPLKLTAGTNLTAAEAGAIEFDGSNLYFTDSVPTRRTIATTTSSTFTGISTIGNAGDITLAPTATTGSVLVNSGTPSISTGTGALVVTGGVGITNGLNMGGSFNLSGTGTHSQSYTGTGTGASIAANSLTSGSILDLSSTSTAAAAGNTGLNIAISGANATAGITRTGVKSSVTATGATSTNVGASFSASGATNNYGLLVPSGRVGIGTVDPSAKLDISAGTTEGIRILNDNSVSYALMINNATYGNTDAKGFGFWQENSGYGAISVNNHLEQLILAPDGKVGIGITAPNELLDVQRDQGARTAIRLANTSAAADAHAEIRMYSNVENSGFAIGTYGSAFANPAWIASKNGFFSNDRPMFFAVDPANEITFNSRFGPEFVRITGTGDMGIGTAAPTTKLEVNGVVKSSAGGFTFPDGTTMTTAGAAAVGSTSTTDLNFASDSDANGSGAMIFASAGTERMRIQSNGNIGIGTNNPVVNFQVQGNAYFGDGLRSGGVAIGAYGPWGATSNAITTGAGADLLFYPGGAEQMRMTSTGRLGIGTTAPQSPFHVTGVITTDADVQFNSYEAGWAGVETNPYLRKSWTLATGDFLYLGGTGNAANTSQTALMMGRDSGFQVGRGSGTADSLSSTWLTVDTSGEVGIGTDNPTYKLDVSGDIRIASGSKLYVNTTAVCDGTGCTAAPSDRRYKENIQPLDNSLQRILQIQGVSYDWKDKSLFGDQHQIGIIAQDIERIYPEVVKTDKKTGFKAVMYDKLVAPVIESIKIIVAHLDSTDATVASQAREIAAIKVESERLKQENAAMKIYLCSKDSAAAFCK